VADPNVEIRSRLLSVHDVLAHETDALEEFSDHRVEGALWLMEKLRAEILHALAAMSTPAVDADGA
jgi:hypothetical protein